MGGNRIESSRRNFIKRTVAAAGTVAISSFLEPFKILVFASDPPKDGSPWWGVGIDISKCIGCGMCAKACKLENHVPQEPFYYRTWVEQYTVLNDGTVKVESPNGGIDGFEQSVDDEDIFKTFFVPKMCNHCAKSPCTQVCPVGATFESPDGVALVDQTSVLDVVTVFRHVRTGAVTFTRKRESPISVHSVITGLPKDLHPPVWRLARHRPGFTAI